jgi:hypothetical protein
VEKIHDQLSLTIELDITTELSPEPLASRKKGAKLVSHGAAAFTSKGSIPIQVPQVSL